MTKKEMTEIFSVMMLAWPNAEMFKGGVQKLGPTIELWAVCLLDIDFWLAQQTVVRLCRECKFPPTIAEFKEKAEAAKQDIKNKIDTSFQQIRTCEFLYGSLDAYYESLPQGSEIKAVIDAMGGVQALTITHGQVSQWNLSGFETTYRQLVRNENVLEGSNVKALAAARKEDLL